MQTRHQLAQIPDHADAAPCKVAARRSDRRIPQSVAIVHSSPFRWWRAAIPRAVSL